MEPDTILYVKFTGLHGRDTIPLVGTVQYGTVQYSTVQYSLTKLLYEYLLLVCIIRLETVDASMFHVFKEKSELLHSSTSVLD